MQLSPALGIAALLVGGCSNAGAVEGPAAARPAQDRPAGAQRGGGAPYEIVGSQVWDVPDPASGRTYQVFVQLPPSYGREPGRRYPTVYVTDADYAFPIVRQVARRMNLDRPRVEEFILVGLSYAIGDDPVVSRTRDYTASFVNGGGGGAAYQAYLKTTVLPFVEERFRADPARRLMMGHSFGGLLGAQIMFSDPELFSAYALGSPSLWHGKDAIFAAEAAYARTHQDLPARVYMYIGEDETPAPGRNQRYDMVGDSARFEQRLKARNYPGLAISNEVLADEDHLSVAPRGFTHALTALLPAR